MLIEFFFLFNTSFNFNIFLFIKININKMATYYVYAKIIGSRSIPKGSYTAWVGTTPIGFAKKGDLTSDKKVGYYSKCLWTMEVKKDFNKTSIEVILKHHRLLGGESEAGRLVLPLKWFPANRVVTDWFPIASRSVSGIDGEEMLLKMTIHLAEARVTPFSHPVGSLLVAPAWDRPGQPAVPPTHLAPASSAPQQYAQGPYQGYQQMPPPQPYPVSPNPPPMQQFPQYPSQPLYPQQNVNQQQGYYPQQQHIPVIADASQPAFGPPFMYAPQTSPNQTPPGSVGMPAYQPTNAQGPIYMPPPPAYDPSNPYLAVDPNEIPTAPTANNQQQNQQQTAPSYPEVPPIS